MADAERAHVRPHKAIDGLFGGIDDRLVFIERGRTVLQTIAEALFGNGTDKATVNEQTGAASAWWKFNPRMTDTAKFSYKHLGQQSIGTHHEGKAYYSPEERTLMENIVNGGWLQNQARGAGKKLNVAPDRDQALNQS